MYCLIGTNTTENYLRYANAPYESLWYKYPIDLQQYVTLIIANAQRPRVFRGFSTIDLNLEVFTKVCAFNSRHLANHKLLINRKYISDIEKRRQLLFDD